MNAAAAPSLPMPAISVVVATYNRAETLTETLGCLAAQTLPADAFEVIVVDDGSTDDTRAVVEAAQRRHAYRLDYLHHPNRGPGATQNRGIRAARAPTVLLIADDIFLAPGALEAHLAGHARHPGAAVAVLGRVRQSPRLTQTVFLSKWEPWHLADLPDGQPMPYYMFWACNISFDRAFMLEHGMFRDERGRAGAAAHEDVELGYRLHRHGLRVYYAAGALGLHHHVETLEGTMKRSYQRGLNWADFRQRVPQPEIDILYRVYNPLTLVGHRAALTGERREHLVGGDRSLVRLTLRYFLRCALFNRATVHALWLPLFHAAERHPPLARLVHSNMYRGVVVHYFLKGCRDGAPATGATPQSRTETT